MTRKHFNAVAALLRTQMSLARTDAQRATLYTTATGLAEIYAQANPRFDSKRFLTAAGVL